MADTIFDVAVVGGGPAGYSCAFRAAQYGLKVALVEISDKLGGTCLHVGCVPTKAMLHSADIFDHANEATMYGIDGIGGGTVNWPQVLNRKNDIINKHVGGLNYLVKKNKVTLVRVPASSLALQRTAFTRWTSPASTARHRRCRRRRSSLQPAAMPA